MFVYNYHTFKHMTHQYSLAWKHVQHCDHMVKEKTVLENFEGDIYSLGEHDHNPLCFSVSKWQVCHYTYVKICIFYKQWATVKLWHYGMTQDLTWSKITWYAWWKYCNGTSRIWNVAHLYDLIFARDQFWPLSIFIACSCVSIRAVYQSQACPDNNSS